MREILFRAKSDSTNLIWIYGSINLSYMPEINIALIDNGENTYKCLPDTIGQYTGLTDKTGKKIFEGDVVKFTDSPFEFSYTGVVCFNEGSFCIKYEYWEKEEFHRIGQTDKWQNMGASGTVTYEYEVLGNIHDNPELLES